MIIIISIIIIITLSLKALNLSTLTNRLCEYMGLKAMSSIRRTREHPVYVMPQANSWSLISTRHFPSVLPIGNLGKY